MQTRINCMQCLNCGKKVGRTLTTERQRRGGRRNRETWHHATWQRGTRSNRGVRARLNRGGPEQSSSVQTTDRERGNGTPSNIPRRVPHFIRRRTASFVRRHRSSHVTDDVVANNWCCQRLSPKPTQQWCCQISRCPPLLLRGRGLALSSPAKSVGPTILMV